MIVTEEEAAGKSCQEVGNAGLCVGSGCMAWRWEDDNVGPRDTANPRKGFCGKAGYPMEILDES